LHILEELGRGASAVVKRAVHTKTGREFVVKCFNIFSEGKRNMLKEEVSILLEIDCRSIVRFLGAFLDESHRISIILEYMDRGSVEDMVKFCRASSVRLPERVLAGMTFQVLWGLNFLNFMGFMHRDIKPPNLLVNRDGETKITDFGIGKKVGQSSSFSAAARVSQARTEGDAEDEEDEQEDDEDHCASTFVGTRMYMSPERLQGEKYGHNADIWSLGIILAEAMLGYHPLRDCGDNFADLVMTLRDLPNGTLGSILPDTLPYSGEMISFVSWCLAVDPSLRGHANELIEDDWFIAQLNGAGSDEAVLDEAVGVVGDFLRTTIPDYMGPNDSSLSTSWEDSLRGANERPRGQADDSVDQLGEAIGDHPRDSNFDTLDSTVDRADGGFDRNFQTLDSDDDD